LKRFDRSRSLSECKIVPKSAIAIARLGGKERNFSGEHFWARCYAVSTMGFELEQVRQYTREQDAADGNGQF
jgi:REP element-mobilizing transposase RayT